MLALDITGDDYYAILGVKKDASEQEINKGGAPPTQHASCCSPPWSFTLSLCAAAVRSVQEARHQVPPGQKPGRTQGARGGEFQEGVGGL